MKAPVRSLLFMLLILASCSTAEESESKKRSASYQRFREGRIKYEQFNEFHSIMKTSTVTGIGFEKGVARRDPTGVIKIGDLFYVWYTRPPTGIPVVGHGKGSDTLRAYPWDLADIWFSPICLWLILFLGFVG